MDRKLSESFARTAEEARRILSGMRAEVQQNHHMIEQSRKAIRRLRPDSPTETGDEGLEPPSGSPNS